MSALWTGTEIAAATGGTLHGEFTVDAVTFDSREVIGGELFVALKGETTDGHRFVDSARERGAAGFLVSEPVEGPHVLVADGYAALEALGRAARARTGATIIGVTGSVGKTSIKEALAMALSEVAPGRAHRSVKSYNNHTGVPLSLARMPAESAFGVLEMGMSEAGELSRRTALVRPHIAIITWVASAHREFFASEADIADAKAEIFEGLEPGGTAILPRDSEHFGRLEAAARQHASHLLTFGLSEQADVRPLRTGAADNGATIVIADVAGTQVVFQLPLAGRHWVSNAMAVLAAAHAAGADVAAAALGLAQMSGLPGRGERFEAAVAGGTVTVLDESYNANPASMRAALAVLGETATQGRRIAVLGAMKEMGPLSERFHAELACPMEEAKVDRAILVGAEMKPLASGLAHSELVEDAAAAGECLARLLQPGDTVLVKGSNSVGLGKLVTRLKEGTG